MPRFFNYKYILGRFLGLFARLHLLINETVLKARTRDAGGEMKAGLPFDSRIRFQHIVLKGKGGFLFHRDHDALDQLAGRLVFHQRQIDVWIDAIRTRADWCKAHGSAMRFMIIPEKHVVYSEKLPGYTKISDSRPVMQLLGIAGNTPATRILYPAEALRSATARRQTFYKTDTHWTSYGAFIGYQTLVDSLRSEVDLDVVDESELTWSERPHIGDLGVRFTPERGETVEAATPASTYRVTFQNHNFGRGAVHIYETGRRDLPTCVLFRDSFANAMIPFLMRGFSRLVAVSSLSCHYDLLEQEKPDVVLFVMIERFIATFGMKTTIELPEDLAGISFAAFSGTELTEVAETRREA